MYKRQGEAGEPLDVGGRGRGRPQQPDDPAGVRPGGLDRGLVEPGEVVAGQRPPGGLVLGVLAELAQVHAQVVLQELHLAGEAQLRGGVGDDPAGRAVGLDPRAPVADVLAVQGDRHLGGTAAHVPDVDEVADDGDAGRGGQHARGEDEVLVDEAAVGKADRVLFQEGPVVQLVDAEGVADELGPLRGPLDHIARGVQPGHPGHVVVLRQLTAYARADGHRRAVLLGGAHEGVGRPRGQDVVAVEEEDVRRGRTRDPVVARGTASAAVLRAVHDLEAGMDGGQLVQRPRGAVGRGVVHGDHLGDDRALGESRGHGLAHEHGVVVRDHHDGNAGSVGAAHPLDPRRPG